MSHKKRKWTGLELWLGICMVWLAVQVEANSAWNKVQEILSSTRDIIVLDGVEKAPLRYPGEDREEYGDWMVLHMLSDPEKLNPYTSSDRSASRVLGYIFESLLFAENEPPYTLKGLIAKNYPTISKDKLSYSFEIREDIHFSDGKPLTADDVLFSMKVVKNPQVLAPHMRNYFAAIKGVRQNGRFGITFICDVPYFRNDLALGSFEILPKHFYDPDGLLDPVSIGSLIDGSWGQGQHADRVRKFAEQFNQNFNRRALGSGPYLIEDVEKDVITQQKIVLTRNSNYWELTKRNYLHRAMWTKLSLKSLTIRTRLS